MKVTKKLTEGNIYKNLLLYAIPLILSSLLSQAYNTIDGIIAGKFIDEFALGAISATSSWETLLSGTIHGFATGFSIYLSQLFGKNDYATIKRDILSMAAFMAMISVAISTLVIGFRQPIMRYLNVDPVLWRNAEIYMTIYVAGYLFYYVNLIFVSSLQALGVTSYALYISTISAVLNIGGNLLTIVVFDMGVAGLALSTVVSAAVATVIYMEMLRRAFREMPTEKISYRLDFSFLTRSLRYSLPAAIQKLAFSGVSFVISPAINALGAAATTGYSVSNRFHSICVQSLWGVSNAFACYTGQSIGEGSVQKVRRGVKVGFLMCCVGILPFVLVMSIFGGPIASIFFPNGYVGEAYQYAVLYAHIYLPFLYVQLVQHFFHSYLRSLGRVSLVLWITMMGSIIRIVGTLWMTPILGLEGVFLAQIIGWAIDAAVSYALYFFRYRTETHLMRVVAKH